MEFIQRDLGAILRDAMKFFPAVVLTGPRQSGKTTLLQNLARETHAYISLEDPDTRSRVLADPRGFLTSLPGPAILDEIQYAPEILPYLKTSIDDHKEMGKWLISGSQHFSLMAGVTESLAGRAAILTLLPFGWLEFQGYRQKDRTSLSDRMIRGFYPQLVAEPEMPRDLWCSSYVQTYLERDVRSITNVGDLTLFEQFVRMVAGRTGQILNVSELGRDVGVTSPTAKRWLSMLEASGLVFLLRPYHRNFGKRLMKSPKVYFIDTGLASYLFGLHDAMQLSQSPYWGALFETLVISEWVKVFLHAGKQPPLYFWRSSDGLEVDLIVDYGGKLFPLEIKATQTPTPVHGENLSKWIRRSEGTAASGKILCGIEDQRGMGHGITAVPWANGITDWATEHGLHSSH